MVIAYIRAAIVTRVVGNIVAIITFFDLVNAIITHINCTDCVRDHVCGDMFAAPLAFFRSIVCFAFHRIVPPLCDMFMILRQCNRRR